MSNLGTHNRPTDRRFIAGIGLAVFAALLIAAFIWTNHDKEAARNDPRAGTTSETSPKNPTPAPGGGSDKRG